MIENPISASEIFVDHALAGNWDDLPPEARRMAVTFLHDSLAVGCAGAAAPFGGAVLRAARSWGGGGNCMVLGRPDQWLPAPQAAFVNAFQIHNQEFDAVHEPAVVHPLATVVAALLASAERDGPVSGSDFLMALSVGVDVAVGLGVAATTSLKFFRPATAGIFGCVAALTRLRRLDRAVAVDAMGLALAFASGTMQAHLEGLATLPLQIASAAQGAIQAVDLALAGLPGARGSIEGPFGYLALFEDGSDLAHALAELPHKHRITEVSWKPFPTGRAAHGAAVATMRLVADHHVGAEDVERLVYWAPPLIRRLVGRPAHSRMTPAYARLCYAYIGASILQRGSIGLADFSAERLGDPAVLAVAERIEVMDDGSVDPAAFVPARAVADLRDGRRLTVSVDAQLGSPENPLTHEQHLAKAATCLQFAGMSFAIKSLAELTGTFADAPDAIAAINGALSVGGNEATAQSARKFQ